MKTTTTLVLAIILSLQCAFAAESFGLKLPQQQASICSCTSGSISFTLFNTNPGQETVTYIVDGIDSTTVMQSATSSTYSVLLSGEAASWTTASPSRFMIKSGEQQQVQLSWRVPCNIKGKKKLTVTLQTDSGTAQSFDIWQEVTRCENIKLAPKQNSYSGCPCRTAVFEYVIQNTGDFPEEYTVGADKLIQYTTVSEGAFVLQPKQAKSIYMYVTPECGLYGTFEGAFSVKAKGSETVAETPYYLDILPCYDYAAYLGKPVTDTTAEFEQLNGTYSICKGQMEIIPVQFKNQAEIPNSYEIRTRQKFAALSTDAIHLSPGQTTTVFIRPDTSKEGLYNAELKVRTVIGSLDSTLLVQYDIINCDTPIVEPLTLAVEYAEQSNEVLIKNTGKREAAYTTILYGPEWARLGQQTITIGNGMSEKLAVITRPTNDTEKGTYETTLVLRSETEYVFPLNIKLEKKSDFTKRMLDFMLLYKWYLLGALLALILLLALGAAAKKPRAPKQPAKKPEIPGEKLAEKLTPEKPEKKEKPIKPKKRTMATLLFLIFIIAAILAMGYFGYQYYKQQQPEEVPKPPGYSMFNLTPQENITEEPTEKPEARSALDYLKEKYSSLKPGIESAKQRVQRFRTWITPYYKYLLYLIAAIIAVFIIWKLAAKPKLLVGLLIILLFMAGVAYLLRPLQVVPQATYQQDAMLKVADGGIYGYNSDGNVVNTKTLQVLSNNEFVQVLEANRQEIIENTNITGQQIDATIDSLRTIIEGLQVDCGIILKKNTPLAVNLSRRFYDPDKEKLQYSSTEQQHLLVEIDGDIATLTPEPGYVGNEYVEFQARDKSGAEATSGEITICIEDTATGSHAMGKAWEWIKIYILYIAAGIAILAVIILVLRYREPIQPPRPSKKRIAAKNQ
ncbi:MAG: hypothetical protein ABIF10_00445 [Candidatus Woesearchaeota archaeon]